jgi:hypothetical protein
MLDELDEEVDTTHSRLRATQKKVGELAHSSGLPAQQAVVIWWCR